MMIGKDVSVNAYNLFVINHMIIDGASTDGTINLLEEYKKRECIQYFSEPDNGIYDAMNKGIKKSIGKYVVFLNSDDFFCNCNQRNSFGKRTYRLLLCCGIYD